MRRTGCVFCDIATCDPHSQVEVRIRESVVITPLNPVVPDHKLVIPMRHVEDAGRDPHATAQVMRDTAIYLKRYDVGDCNIITSVGEDATQTIWHLHVHIVPRCAGDGLALPWTRGA